MGSTVVNNAVCIRAPEDVLERWNDPRGLNAGIELEKLKASFDHIGAFLKIQPQPDEVFSDNSKVFRAGAKAVGWEGAVHVVDGNIEHCRGCGYCNIGCEIGSKLSMLDKVLPAAQSFDAEVRIPPNCEAERFEMVPGQAQALRCKLENGRTVHVRARGTVVSAGAIGSSLLLQRSGIRPSAAGAGLGFNMATPLTAYFPDTTMKSYDELQISHYLRPPEDNAGYVIETWFNPPAMQSLFMPGWGEPALPEHVNTGIWRAPASWSGRSPTATSAGARWATSASSPRGRTSRS